MDDAWRRVWCTRDTACSWAWTSVKRITTRSALAPDGKRLHDAPLPKTEARLRELFDKLGPARPGAGRGRPARHDRRAAGRGGPGLRASGGLPARAGDAPHR